MLKPQTIGNRISEARRKKGISQAQLAAKLCISPQAVGKWERGESMPDIITLNRLAEILLVDLNYFSAAFYSEKQEIKSHTQSKEIPEAALQGQPAKVVRKNMSQGNWVDADFSGLKNLHEKFSMSNMQRCIFADAGLNAINLNNNNIKDCDFSGAGLSGSNFHNTYIQDSIFKTCVLKETGFSGTFISGSDFSTCDFSGVAFKSGGFEKNSVADAVWMHTSFVDMYLADIVFEGVVDNCIFENCSFKRVSFNNAHLKDTFFKCKSLKNIRFSNCTADKISGAFLKNGKADMSGISILAE